MNYIREPIVCLYYFLWLIILNDDDLEELLNNATIQARSNANLKKKEDMLLKMKMNDIKALAKNHNISLIQANKPKKKEVLIQNLLSL